MRVRSAVRKLCEACKIVKRRGKVYVICKSSGKHKQRQGFHTQTAAQTEQAMQQQRHAQQRTGVLSDNMVRAQAPQQHTSSLGEMLWRQKGF